MVMMMTGYVGIAVIIINIMSILDCSWIGERSSYVRRVNTVWVADIC